MAHTTAHWNRIHQVIQLKKELTIATQRLNWILDNPESARHLLQLLETGKGNKAEFLILLDKLISTPKPTPSLKKSYEERRTDHVEFKEETPCEPEN